MSDDLAQRAARHRPDPNWEGAPSYCIACSIDDGEAFHDVLWPCLVHDLAAALAAERVARARAEQIVKMARLHVKINREGAEIHRLLASDMRLAKAVAILDQYEAALAGEERR